MNYCSVGNIKWEIEGLWEREELIKSRVITVHYFQLFVIVVTTVETKKSAFEVSRDLVGWEKLFPDSWTTVMLTLVVEYKELERIPYKKGDYYCLAYERHFTIISEK